METGFADEESPSSMNGKGAQMMVANYGHPPLSVIKVFSCKYCSRKFLNPRAFGGHQNAHKKERKIDMFICNHYKAAAAAAQHASALDLNKPAAEELSTPSHVFKLSAGEAGQSHNLDLDLHL